MNFVDTVMAGNLGPRALAAVAVGGSLWMMVALFIMGVLTAVTASVSQLFGARKQEEVGHFVRQALWLGQGLGLVCFLVIRNADPLLYWLEIEPEIIPITLGYIDAITWGLPALCAFVVFRYFSAGVSMTRPILVISLIGFVTNIAGNYVFMYGQLGLPPMGAVGCGWASALVMWMNLLCLVTYVGLHPYYRPFRIFKRFDWPRHVDLVGTLRLGLPIGISVFLEASLFATVALLMGSLGTTTVAGHQIAINFASITFMIPLGLSIAITVRVGQAMGRGSQSDARRAGFVGVCLALGFMAISAVAILLFPERIVSIYTDDAAVELVAIDLLFMAAIFQLSDGSQVRRCRGTPRSERHNGSDADYAGCVLGDRFAPGLHVRNCVGSGATGHVDRTHRRTDSCCGLFECSVLFRHPPPYAGYSHFCTRVFRRVRWVV